MKIGLPPQTVAFSPAVTPASRGAPMPTAADPADNAASRARLEHLVELIEHLTGRDIKLVPPTTYLVSAPNHPEPIVIEPVEVPAAPPTVPSPSPTRPEPLEVDISAIIRSGTTARMRLVRDDGGALALHPQLDLEL